MDAVLFGGPELSAKFLFGCARALKDSRDSVWIQISDDPPDRRLSLLRAVLPGWRVRYEKIYPEGASETDPLFEQEHWGYVITKT